VVPCPSARRQFEHLRIGPDRCVGDVNVAGGVHRHSEGSVETGEPKIGLRGQVRRQFHHPTGVGGEDCR
jgi:hypothetical protein